ncbi:MAG: penicillin-binding protein 1A, partial [Gammaproteobacteria bacterium]
MKKSAFKKTPFYSLLLRWIACAAILCMTTLLAFGYSVYNRIMIDLPDIMTLHHVRYQTPLKIYSNDRQLIGQYGEQNRIPVSIDQVPAPLIHAFLAAEDERFFEHPGVDFKGLIRAGLQLALTGKKSQGGSTITMQITRNLLLSNEKTYIRKLKEIILALKIEREYSKNKILELYLNQIYMGHRSYGVAAAAHTYYGKSLNALSLAETAMIAGLPKAPSAYNPVTNLKRALLRRNYVLHRMLELNYISNQEYQEALQQASTAKLQFQPVELSAPYVAEMARRAMVSRYGEKVYTSGYHVYTTIDGALQKAANTALAEALHRYDERHGYRSDESSMAAGNVGFADLPSVGDTMPAHIVQIKKHQIVAKLQNDALIAISEENFKRIWKNFFGNKHRDGDSIFNPVIRVRRLSNGDWALAQIPQVEGAFVALNPGNGAILALTGGFDFARNQFNRVTQSKRQPGSGFKPFIYAAALEEGFTPASLINDEPLIIEDPNQEVEWRPENYNRNFLGPTSLRKALTLSTNIISVRLLEHIGIEKAVSTAQRFGFNNQQLPKTLSLALGSGHASPLQMARAYAAFANGGFLIQPYLIDRVETKQGQVIFRNEALTACPQCSSDAD